MDLLVAGGALPVQVQRDGAQGGSLGEHLLAVLGNGEDVAHRTALFALEVRVRLDFAVVSQEIGRASCRERV